MICRAISQGISKELPFSSKCLLLNYVDFFPKDTQESALNVITSARLVFARLWKRSITPYEEEQFEKLNEHVQLGKLNYMLHGKKLGMFDEQNDIMTRMFN